MSNNKEINIKIPKIFLSYSHDNPEHKKWVSELASRLVKDGVEVIFDQWDVGLGDDLPKFMEKAVNDADRVLMICTEPYVRKADDGKGGVGYEAMIVTGELIANLGTNKFIPIVKQDADSPVLPKALSTRFYVDLSTKNTFDTNFEQLLRELHNVPVMVKPELGKNPFAKLPSGNELQKQTTIELSELDIAGKDIIEIYHDAHDIARQGDMGAWRKIVRQTKKPISNDILKWRAKYEKDRAEFTAADLTSFALEGLTPYAPLFAISLAGIESGRKSFVNQISFLDEIKFPKDWNGNGLTRIVHLPQFAIFIFHSLHGALCLQTEQIPVAMNLICTRMNRYSSDISQPLYKNHEFMGWADTIGGRISNSWRFLMELSNEWTWLNEIFGDIEDYKVAMCAYYMALNIFELANFFIENPDKIKIPIDRELSLKIPACFIVENDLIQRKAYTMLTANQENLKSIWHKLNLTDECMKSNWDVWLEQTLSWCNRVYQYQIFNLNEISHQNLFKDLTRRYI